MYLEILQQLLICLDDCFNISVQLQYLQFIYLWTIHHSWKKPGSRTCRIQKNLRVFGSVIRAFGSVIVTFGSLIRAFGSVIRAFAASRELLTASESFRQRVNTYQNPICKRDSIFSPCIHTYRVKDLTEWVFEGG